MTDAAITTTTINNTITAAVAINEDGAGAVVMVVGVTNGLGTGEAACKW